MPARVGLDKAAVVRAAAALADEAGFEHLSLAALAAQLGVRSPTLYHYVDGLPGLARELAVHGDRVLAAHLGGAVMGQAGPEAILALAGAYRAFVKAHPGLYAATVRAPAPGDAEWQAAAQSATDVALRALSAYRMAPEEALHTVRALRSLVHGFASLEVAGGFGLPLALDASFGHLLRVFLRGLATPD